MEPEKNHGPTDVQKQVCDEHRRDQPKTPTALFCTPPFDRRNRGQHVDDRPNRPDDTSRRRPPWERERAVPIHPRLCDETAGNRGKKNERRDRQKIVPPIPPHTKRIIPRCLRMLIPSHGTHDENVRREASSFPFLLWFFF